MPDSNNLIERKTDSLFFVLANKPWTAAAVAAYSIGLFLLGVFVGGGGGG